MKKLPSKIEEIPKSKIRGGRIIMSAYIPPEHFFALTKYANPDQGDQWQSELLRRVIREWLNQQSQEESDQDKGTQGGQGVRIVSSGPVAPPKSSQQGKRLRGAQK